MAQSFKEKIKTYLLQLANGRNKNLLNRTVWVGVSGLACVYRWVLSLRFRLYRCGILRARVQPLKVISVGNITVGGTGKTPLVQLIIGRLIAQQRRPAVISRGYKGGSRAQGYCADEPEMLKTMFPDVPVLINPDRNAAAAAAFADHHCDCVVLDDGLQNLAIAKQLEIVCIDCRNPFGNGRVLPAGTMRLPLMYLSNADIVVLTHSDTAPENIPVIKTTVLGYNKKIIFCQSKHVPRFFSRFLSGGREKLDKLIGKKTALLCAIADPRGFEETVFALGAHIVLRYYFEDHHCFRPVELSGVFGQCREQGIEVIVTTAKDEPRLRQALGPAAPAVEILVLHIELELESDENIFNNR
ncbi:MAG: tetraacyldisaccharide 4'-kinase, partial [Candidatus Omnitrophica bacterium]|nr:tetraacyldisaccharide 4'-kinase [Candidatus Omnitrophota bacterium]